MGAAYCSSSLKMAGRSFLLALACVRSIDSRQRAVFLVDELRYGNLRKVRITHEFRPSKNARAGTPGRE